MEVTGLITALIVGLIIGALGRLVAPGRQKIPIWLTLLVGIVAALIGTALAAAIGVAVTPGIDWIELIIQVVLAAVGVTTADGLYGRRSARTWQSTLSIWQRHQPGGQPARTSSRKEENMGTDDKIENKTEELTGQAKETVGDATDDEDLQVEGKAEKAKGSLKQAGEKVKDGFKSWPVDRPGRVVGSVLLP
jgi:uncharacterized protein YjbJ (UPF0337 family)/uncharacterized membrane protein YeaQ/YmgE (transglycosylase-associated protein family)